MLDLWTQASTIGVDAIFGRLLGWSWTATVAALAITTGLLLAGIRRWTTDQALLHRAAADKRRLNALIREAKKEGRKDDVRRYKQTKALVAMRTFSQEGKPLLCIVLPVAVLATWCYERLDFHPPRDGEPVTVEFRAPVSAVGETVHLLPREGLSADEGWIREIRADPQAKPPAGVATWTVRGQARKVPYDLRFVLGGKPVPLPASRDFEDGKFTAMVKMRPAKFLGVIPSLGVFPSWLLGYLTIVIVAAPGFKRLLRVA
jgi:hypothetical protein